MKLKTTLTLILLYVVAHVYSQNPFTGESNVFVTDSKNPVISDVFPNGGESYYFGQSLPVNWTASDESLGSHPITVYISLDGGFTYALLAETLANGGSALLTLPQAISDQIKIKVVVQDEFGYTASMESSSVFSLLGSYISLKVFLEGSFDGTGMSTFLNSNNLIPLNQPYAGVALNYQGTESVNAIPNSDIVDWVLVELRDAASASSASQTSVIHRQAAFLLKNGEITGLDGSSELMFGLPVDQQLFAVVYHRNHAPVISANPLMETGNQYYFDFTAGAGQVLGGVNGHKEISAGVWGLFSGDGNGDGDVHNGDKNDVWNMQSGASGYLEGDFNLDGDVNNNDKIQNWTPNSGRSSQVPV
ncbi:MAG: hypothetical protein JXA03_16590 [Bacteroidales bacterium]|nr:hypothetical protein [Bacteroidales bacterium]